MPVRIHHTDFLVLGSGIAGLSFALKVAPVGRVTLITKKEDTESNTNYAQGGIASVIGAEDSPESHFEDTVRAGAGLCHDEAVRVLVTEGPERVRELVDWGVRFTYERGEGGRRVLSLGREGGHSRRRIVRADDLTGREIERALLTRLLGTDGFRLFEDHYAADLIVVERSGRGRRCLGAVVYNRRARDFEAWVSPVTFLATGGSGRAYLHTTNPEIATGDGVAMAFRAGAKIANMEFFQFHPTALYPARGKAFLISEAVRGEGAVLVDMEGRAFMKEYDPRGDLAPRDVVARAIDREMKLSGVRHVYLDLSPIDPSIIRRRFPNITRECRRRGIDITKDPIPVVAAAHYMCGGVVTDIWARTSVEGLFAAGEVACTGVHGANRLASNSLLEAVVFSHRASIRAKEVRAEEAAELDGGEIPRLWSEGRGRVEAVVIRHLRERLRTMMWDCVGIVRTMDRLAMASRELPHILEEIEETRRRIPFTVELEELRNMARVADLIVRCAMSRRESRGLNYNLDFPETDDEGFRQDTVIWAEGGEPVISLGDDTGSRHV
jgi:L-aspartate oxidase